MRSGRSARRCLAREPGACAMNPEMAMEPLGSLHGAAGHEPELMGSPSPHHGGRSAGPLRVPPPPPPPPPHQELAPAAARPAMVSSMASLLDGAAEYRPELSIPLHHAMSMPCESSPPGMGMSSTYTTLTPLQPLPPISTVSDKFHHPHAHPHAHHHHHHQRLSGNVSGSFALMRDERGLPAVNNLYGPYKEMPGMGQSLSPLGNGLGPLHNAQQGLHGYGPPGHDKMLSPNFDAHAAMLARGDQHLSRGLGTPPAMMPALNGMHHAAHPGHPPPHGPALPAGRERPPSSSSGSQVSSSGQLEEINTKEVAQRITAELKRYSIPQAIFAQRVLCRSQGTLSDLLRNPKPWSKLKSGRETFRRMWKWLQEPEFQRMSALRLAGSPGAVCGTNPLLPCPPWKPLIPWIRLHEKAPSYFGDEYAERALCPKGQLIRLFFQGEDALLSPAASVTARAPFLQLTLGRTGGTVSALTTGSRREEACTD
ncbi:one cut domain family member 2 isoform X1 [Phalacrocorax aristotelis]|uniref:one cut domain family member 2 isoform X1 n=1 Tax=Phalacrocorax aristotelis TaxID=126867 RepID=UPI003F4C2DE1